MNNTKIVTRLLVGPPASRGHFSNAHHELSKMISPLKLEKRSLIQFWQLKNAKTEPKSFLDLTHDFFYCLTII
jgi:hypothetical protein